MRSLASRLAGIAGVIVIGLVAASCGPQPNDPVKNASAAAHKAADQFVALAHGSETSGQVPRQTDPAAGPLLDAVFNTNVLHSGPTPSLSQMDPVNDWLFSTVRVGQVYLLAGTGVTDVSKATDPATETRAESNIVTYAPEYGRYLDAQLSVMDELAAIFNKELAANPGLATANSDTTQGLAKIKSGVTTALISVIATLQAQGLTDDWRRARMAPLLAIAPEAAKLVLPADKAKLHDAALQVAATLTDPDVKAKLTSFADLISR